MCCICFSRFDQKDLYRDDNGNVWDVCKECDKGNLCVQCGKREKLYMCVECFKPFCGQHWGDHDDCLM